MKLHNLDLLGIILELSRMQQLEHSFVHNFRIPIQPDKYVCPQCHRQTYNALEFRLPEIAPGAFDVLKQTDPANAVLVSTRVIEGHCGNCGNDWWRTMCAMEPEAKRDPVLRKFPPKMRYNQPCDQCKERALLGFFRKGVCTAGMCVTCRKIIAPLNVTRDFIRRRREYGELKRNKEKILGSLANDILHPKIHYTDEPDLEWPGGEFTLWND